VYILLLYILLLFPALTTASSVHLPALPLASFALVWSGMRESWAIWHLLQDALCRGQGRAHSAVAVGPAWAVGAVQQAAMVATMLLLLLLLCGEPMPAANALQLKIEFT